MSLLLTSSNLTHWSDVSTVELKQVHTGWADGGIQEVRHSPRSPIEVVQLGYKSLIE